MRGNSKPSSTGNGVYPVLDDDDGKEAERLPTPLAQREVRRARGLTVRLDGRAGAPRGHPTRTPLTLQCLCRVGCE